MSLKVEDSQSFCSWQKAISLVIGAAAITAIVIGVLAMKGIKLEDLTPLASLGMTLGGSVTLVAIVGGVIYFQCSPRGIQQGEEEAKGKSDTKAHASTVEPPLATPQQKAPHRIEKSDLMKLVAREDFVTLTPSEAESATDKFQYTNTFKEIPCLIFIYREHGSKDIVVFREDNEASRCIPFSKQFKKEGSSYVATSQDHVGLNDYLNSLYRLPNMQYYWPQDPASSLAKIAATTPTPSPDLEEIGKEELWAQIKRDEFGTLTEAQAQNISCQDHQMVIYRDEAMNTYVWKNSRGVSNCTRDKAGRDRLLQSLEREHRPNKHYYRPKPPATSS